ncbi:MAG: STAS domain-containing protein [Rhodobacteraceae bacterium]|jgi:anti-anti-sigma regulatory factor|nr:STAS domain-containing protein [Paracoccaceae bacterium]
MQDTIACFELPPRYSPAEDDELLDFLRRSVGLPVQIDACSLRSFDGLMLELLIMARRSWQAAGQAFEIRNLPDQVEGELRLLGAIQALGLEGGQA